MQALTLISDIALPSPSRAATNSNDVVSMHNTVATDYDDNNTNNSNGIVTRYYRAFSEQVLSRTRNKLVFNLLYRSLKFDPSVDRKLAL